MQLRGGPLAALAFGALIASALVRGQDKPQPASATSPADQRVDPAAAAAGKTIYFRYCATCHGMQAKGDGSLAADLRVPPADLTRLAKRNGGKFPLDRVTRLIDGREGARGHGSSDMPIWGDVFKKTTGTEAPTAEVAISRVAQFLWSIQEASPSTR